MNHRELRIAGAVALIAAGPAWSVPSPAPVQPDSDSANGGATLERLTSEIEPPSGIRFKIAKGLGKDRIQRSLNATSWPEVVRELLRGYNYAGTWDHQGRLLAVSVTGRNGSGLAGKESAPGEEPNNLFAYGRNPDALPVKYREYRSGSVYRIEIPTLKLKQMGKGERVTANLPDGRYVLIHDNAWNHPNNDKTWVGRLAADPGNFRALLTLGDDETIGQIRTPGGLYRIESADGSHWLVDVNAAGLHPAPLTSLDQSTFALGSLMPAASTNLATVSANRAESASAAAKPRRASINADGKVVIDTLLLYSSGLGDSGSALTKLNSTLAFANQALVDSRIDVVLRLAAARRTSYSDGGGNGMALNRLTSATGGFENVPELRRKFGADVALLVRPFKSNLQGGNCGEAWVNGSGGEALSADLAYGVIGYGASRGFYCSEYTLAHEIGHIMGAAHDREHANVPGRYRYSYGYGVEGRFGDIMSYVEPGIGMFANPRLTTCDGLPCGIAEGKPKAADVALTFTNTARVVSSFFRSKTP